MSSRRFLSLAICLCLLYSLSRLYHLNYFPPFLDEVDHILWAKDVYSFHPFTGAVNGKLFGLWWMSAFALEGNGLLFVVRAATILFQLLSLATLIRLGRYFGGIWGAVLAAAFYILSPYAYFYDRLALMDAYVLPFGLLALYFSLRYYKSQAKWLGLLAGLSLLGTVLAKATGLMLWPVPALVFILLKGLNIHQRLQSLFLIYLSAGLPSVVLYLFLRSRGYNYFSTATTVVGSGVDANIFQRLFSNIFGAEGILYIDVLYFSLPFLLFIALAGLVYLRQQWRAALLLLGASLIPLAALLSFASKMSPRYFHFHVPFVFLFAASAIVSLGIYLKQRYKLPEFILHGSILLIWGFGFALPFLLQYFTDLNQLAIPRLDHLEYFQSDAAGFGIPETAAYINEAQNQGGESHYVYGILPNCHALRYYLQSAIPLECPTIKLDSSTQSSMDARFDELALELDANTVLWLVYEPTAYTRIAGIESQLALQETFVRPAALTQLELYQLENPTND